VHIGLNPAVPQSDGILEGFQRVFLRHFVATPVGDRQWE
jgi:hypothetical protein